MRADLFLVEKSFVNSRNRAGILFEKDLVRINGKIVKPSYDVKDGDKIEILQEIAYVSMGGYKLEKALKDFKIDINDKTCVDVGCSTGGFTQVMLLGGAKRVYAVDVNTDVLDESISKNPKVEPIKINAKNLSSNIIKENVDFCAVDCSFISLKHLLKPIFCSLSDNGEAVALIKPQFECGAENLTKKGIVKNKKVVFVTCLNIFDYCVESGFNVLDVTIAPIREKKNLELLIYLSKIKNGIDKFDFSKKVEEILK